MHVSIAWYTHEQQQCIWRQTVRSKLRIILVFATLETQGCTSRSASLRHVRKWQKSIYAPLDRPARS